MTRRVLALAFLVVRWWFGLTWLVGGAVGVVWGPVARVQGDGGWFFLLVGGFMLLLCGWCFHPWGLERALRPDNTRFPGPWMRGDN